MRNLIFIFLLSISNTLNAQGTMQEYWENFSLQDKLKKHLKFSTVYGAVNGGTSARSRRWLRVRAKGSCDSARRAAG